ncbi:MAG: DUF362 domain-containing protein [bacterium]|nr:MAG: DUF362 domain-containing protein [bacterium]
MLDRRTFLRIMGAGAAGCLMPVRGLASLLRPEEEQTLFAVVHGADPAATVRKAVELLGGMGSFIAKNDVVFVKPNISWDRTPQQAATTNPDVVAAVVRMVLEAGAKKVIVADNACNDARRTYKRSGIKDAAKKAGADVMHMEKRKFVKVDLGGGVLKKWEVFREAIEADKIVNIPIAKHHGLSGVTLSMKNMMGLIGGKRDLLHQKLGESIVDLTAYFKPTLHILDAVRILKAHGPQGGSLKDVTKLDTVAASIDPVKIDAFGITLFGKDPAEFPHLGMAEERGLGHRDFKSEGYQAIELS